jgi:pimeloyl-ACP methyl ester carboxylesterase
MSDARTPLLYLPGMDGTGRLLFRQPAVFDAYDVRCLSYPHAPPRSYDELAGLAADRLEQSGPGVVLAESFGGPVALTLALRRPDLVQRMLLINTFAHYPRRLLIRLGVWLGRLLPSASARWRRWTCGLTCPRSASPRWWWRPRTTGWCPAGPASSWPGCCPTPGCCSSASATPP